ncbi:hypothetical protein LTR28_007564 [Elasticomyces elasticus]|nr:hypothetical protein LTR28_007564 [Elasticomyces elasticus]
MFQNVDEGFNRRNLGAMAARTLNHLNALQHSFRAVPATLRGNARTKIAQSQTSGKTKPDGSWGTRQTGRPDDAAQSTTAAIPKGRHRSSKQRAIGRFHQER